MAMSKRAGYTLVEVLIAVGVSVLLFGSTISAFLTVKSLNVMARHKIQAVQLVRGHIEQLKASPSTIANSSTGASYDAGPDGLYGTSDDMQGTLVTTQQDFQDFDGDGNLSETRIDVDGNGGNDLTAAPVRVSFQWNEYVIGQTRSMTVSVDTIIAQ